LTVLERSDGALREISKIAVGNGPRGGVQFTSDGRGYVGNTAGNTISEIDALTLRETAKITVGIAPIGVGLIPGDRYALVSNSGSNYVSVVDLGLRQEIHKVATGREPRHMAITPDGSAAYVAISGADYVAKIDTSALANNQVESIETDVREVARISVGDGAMPYSVGIVPDGSLAFAVNNQGAYTTIIDLTNDTVVANVDLGGKGGRGVAFTPDGKRAFVTVEDANEVVAIDVDSRAVVNRFETGPGPRGLVFDAAEGVLYSTNFARSRSVGVLTAPNTISSIDFSGSLLDALEKATPNYAEVPVGACPCSVTIFES